MAQATVPVVASPSTMNVDNKTLLDLIAGGDTAKLTPDQKLQYYKARCEAAGLDPRTVPFQFIKLQGREVLYAVKGATDQLASNHKIRSVILSQVTENDVRTVTVRAEAADGRSTDDIGAVFIKGMVGNDLANALMKAVTKAKRRAILSLCGLGVLDETEIETIKGAQVVEMPKERAEEPPKPPQVSGNVNPTVISISEKMGPLAGAAVGTKEPAEKVFDVLIKVKSITARLVEGGTPVYAITSEFGDVYITQDKELAIAAKTAKDKNEFFKACGSPVDGNNLLGNYPSQKAS